MESLKKPSKTFENNLFKFYEKNEEIPLKFVDTRIDGKYSAKIVVNFSMIIFEVKILATEWNRRVEY